MPVLSFFLWVLIWPGPRKLVPLHIRMTEAADLTINYLSPGSICWAAFLEMGARLENSPNSAPAIFLRTLSN